MTILRMNIYTSKYLGQDDNFVPPDEDDAEEDDSESDFHDGAVNRSPLAGRRRGRGRGIVARAAGDGAGTVRESRLT